MRTAVRVKKKEKFGRLHASSTRSHRKIRAHLAGEDGGMLRGRPMRLRKTRAAQTTLERTTEQVLRNATRSTRELLWPRKLAIGKGKAAHMLTAERAPIILSSGRPLAGAARALPLHGARP